MRKNSSNEENSVNCALSELMILEDKRQEEERLKAKIKAEEEKKIKALKEKALKEAEELQRRNEELVRKEAEKIKREQELEMQAKAEAIKLKAIKEAEMAAERERMIHERELAEIEAKKKPTPKWIWGIVAAVLLISIAGIYVQYTNAQEEKAKIRQVAEAEKLRLEAEKIQLAEQKQREAKALEEIANRKELETEAIKLELAEKERLLDKNNNKVIKKNTRKRPTVIKKKQNTNINSNDPLKGLDL